MEAKRNQLADAAAKQLALNIHPVQPWKCPLFSINPANPVKDFFLQVQEITTNEEKQIRQQKGGILIPPHKYGLDMIKQNKTKLTVSIEAQFADTPARTFFNPLGIWENGFMGKTIFWKLSPMMVQRKHITLLTALIDILKKNWGTSLVVQW